MTKKKNNVKIVSILTPRDASLFKFLTTTFTNVLTIVAHADPVNLAMALSNLTKEQILTDENREVVAAHANPSNLAQALIDLHLKDILTDENRRFVAAHANPSNLAQALIDLHLNDILTDENRRVVAAHANPSALAQALIDLDLNDILTDENRRVVAAHANPSALAHALIDLDLNDILTAENRRVVAAHANPSALAQALIDLHLNEILSDENRRVVAAHASPLELARAFIKLSSNLTAEDADLFTIFISFLVKLFAIFIALLTDLFTIFFALLTNIITVLFYPLTLTVVAHILEEARILTEVNRGVVAAHKARLYLLSSLFYLLVEQILTQANFILVAAHNDTEHLAYALSSLQKARILTQDNFNLVAAHNDTEYLAYALSNLQKARILTQDNFNLIVAHNDTEHLAYALSNLKKARILTQANFDLVVTHNDTEHLASVLTNLQKAWILTQENFNRVATHENPEHLASALSNLQKAWIILTQDNFNLVVAHNDTEHLAYALSNLQKARFLTQANFEFATANAALYSQASIVSVLYTLERAWLLTEANRRVVATHAGPANLAGALRILWEAGILTQTNLSLVAAHNDPEHLTSALGRLSGSWILTQANLTALLAPNHATLISAEAYQYVWSNIPVCLLTQANYQRLLTAAEHANPMEELRRVTAEIINPQQGQAARAAVFNQAQSTHTASVHHSVSDSARKLMQSYGEGLKLEDKIAEIKAYVNALPITDKNEAAKLCIARITEPHYSFTDTSGVSTRQLLALAYIAIHDKAKRIGALADAKALFIEALYEIQRGYNLNDAGQDQGGVDVPICLAGTFNKLMEKLNGIHQDVEVVYITHEGASCKFSKLAQEHAIAYLRTLASPQNAVDYKRVKDLLDSIQNEGSLEPIWSEIQGNVRDTLWEEFREAYANNPNNPRFIAMIDNGQYLNSPGLDEIEAQLMASLGREAYLAQQAQLSLRQNSFFSNQDTTNADQVLDSRLSP